MLNPDGVFCGNYRADAGGVDLNRMWQQPSAALAPALHASLGLLHRYASDPLFDVVAYIDVHAHSTSRAGAPSRSSHFIHKRT